MKFKKYFIAFDPETNEPCSCTKMSSQEEIDEKKTKWPVHLITDEPLNIERLDGKVAPFRLIDGKIKHSEESEILSALKAKVEREINKIAEINIRDGEEKAKTILLKSMSSGSKSMPKEWTEWLSKREMILEKAKTEKEKLFVMVDIDKIKNHRFEI